MVSADFGLQAPGGGDVISGQYSVHIIYAHCRHKQSCPCILSNL